MVRAVLLLLTVVCGGCHFYEQARSSCGGLRCPPPLSVELWQASSKREAVLVKP